jgi:hypothetical protein
MYVCVCVRVHAYFWVRKCVLCMCICVYVCVCVCVYVGVCARATRFLALVKCLKIRDYMHCLGMPYTTLPAYSVLLYFAPPSLALSPLPFSCTLHPALSCPARCPSLLQRNR